MSRARRISRTLPIGSAGQAMVEFALVAPIFFLLLFAIIEGGRFILYYQTLANSTREGARYAIVHGSNALRCVSGPMPPGVNPPLQCYDPTGNNVVQRVKDSGFGILGNNVVVDQVNMYPTNNGRGEKVHVAATYTYTTLVPLVPLPAITINAESTLVINN